MPVDLPPVMRMTFPVKSGSKILDWMLVLSQPLECFEGMLIVSLDTPGKKISGGEGKNS